MAESRDALVDTYLSDQWLIHGGPRKRSAREELRDRLIPIVIKVFGSVEFSLDVLLKESPCSNGHRIDTLICAYKLYFLRMHREAVEASDQAAEQRFADLQSHFHELDKYERNLFGTAQLPDSERIRATLRTSVCNLPDYRPAGSTVLDSFRQDTNARPLGDNPFPADHRVYEAFEEATWKAKEAVSSLISELLTNVSKPPFDFIQAILTFRVRGLSACANAALLIVGNEETAEWYERWIEDFASSVLQETLRKGQFEDPQADPGSPPLFTPELLPRITADLQRQLMQVVAHYKEEAAKRVLEVMELRRAESARPEEPLPTETSSGVTITKDVLEDVNIRRGEERLYRRSGDSWELRFGGKAVHVKNTKGMMYIAELLQCPRQDLPVWQLLAAIEGQAAELRPGSAGNILDTKAIGQYKARGEVLLPELAEAKRNNDWGRKEEIEQELDQIAEQLASAHGIGGRDRKASNDVERARKRISRAVKRAIEAIREHHRELADHFHLHVKCGVFCCYRGEGIEWQL